MQILKRDDKNGVLQVKVEHPTDMYILSRVLDVGDYLRARTTRRIKRKDSEGKSGDKGERIVLTLTIRVLEISFADTIKSQRIRVKGVVVEGPEQYIKVGGYHTINVDLNSIVTIRKPLGWMSFHFEMLEEAEKAVKLPLMLAVVIDAGEATLALIDNFRLEFLPHVRERIPRKSGLGGKKRSELLLQFFNKVYKTILRHVELGAKIILIGGPGFIKDHFQDYLRERIPSKNVQIYVENTSVSGRSGINELLKSGMMDKVGKDFRILREMKLVESFLECLSKGTMTCTYGLSKIKELAPTGAIESLIITDKFLHHVVEARTAGEGMDDSTLEPGDDSSSDELLSKEERERKDIVEIIRHVEINRGKVHVVSSSSDPGKQVETFGGIIALLRYPVTW